MKFTSTVFKKGQVTIPLPIRKILGLEQNSKIKFELKNDNEVFIKLAENFFDMKGTIAQTKPFDIDAMDKAVENAISNNYSNKSF